MAAEPSTGLRIEVRPSSIRVVDAETDHAVGGALFSAIGKPIGDTLPIEGSDLPRASDTGHLELVALSGSRAWLVHAPGYCSCVLQDPAPGIVVPLVPARELRVETIGEDGNPVANVQLQLRCKGSPAVLDGLDLQTGIGDPRSPTPAWVATTDGRGQAVFDSVPPGIFYLQALHASTFCQTPEGHGGRPVEAPGHVTLEMKDLFAVCAVAPPGEKVLSYSWSSSPRVDLGAALQKGRVFARRALQRRWPEALVIVSRPMDQWLHEPPRLTCRAVLDGGIPAEAVWPLVSIAELVQPVILEKCEGASLHDLRVRVIDASGRPLAMRLTIVRDVPGEDPVIQSVRTDESFLVTPGVYSVRPEHMPLWLYRHFENCSVEVRPTDPLEVRKDVVLDEVLRLVVITPELAPGALLPGRALHFLVKSLEGGSSYGAMNWEPSKGPIEMMVPPGRLKIGVQGAIHRSEAGVLDVVPGIGPQQMTLKLEQGTEVPDPARAERHRAR